MTTDTPIARSWLFVPAHKERMIAKSFTLDADIVIYDFEDAVPPAEKAASRDVLTNALKDAPAGGPRRWVRVNHPRHQELFVADLAAALELGIEGLSIPKVASAGEVHDLVRAIDLAEHVKGLGPDTRLMLLIESPLGVLNVREIASASPRIAAIAFGGEDFSREMGLPLVRTGEAKDLIPARSSVTLAAAAAGVQPLDVIWTSLRDVEGLAAEARQGRRLGFTGKMAIHPEQIAPIHAAFSPSDEEIAYAREVLAAYDEAFSQGTGAINHKGAFLEEPVIARARRVLELAERFGG